jgi:hypothetical protein
MAMKRIAVTSFLLGALGMVIPAHVARAQVSVSVSIGAFYDELSPYGEWIDCRYGECWVPRGVSAGWQPYSNGEWIYTRYGWTWVSSDPWGGDPYHYGTWDFVDRHGWVWVPGTVWAPAWVTWSYSDRYVGWAPMPPTVTFGSSGYSGRPVVVNQAQYVFVPTNRFVGTNVMSVRVEPQRNAEIFRQAKPVTRFEVSGGVVRNVALPVATVQRATGSRIETREIGTAKTTPRTVSSGGVGRSGHVSIVAPARDMKAARASRHEAAPHAAQPEPQRQQQQAKPQHQEQAKPQQHREQAKPQQHEQAKPEQHQEQAKPQKQQQQAKPQQHQEQARPQQHEQAKPEQHQEQAKPQKQQQQAKPEQHQEQAKPDGKEKGQDQNKEKKDQPGKGEPHG